jgi:hypothetical protein
MNTHNGDYVLAFIVIGLIVIVFILLGKFTNLLRDVISDDDEFNANAQALQQQQRSAVLNRQRPYSLSKVQLGVWTVIIASSYIYLALCKGDCANSDLNKTALILMGIGAGIATTGTIIDKREIQDSRPRHQNSPSEGFFTDLLSDADGICVHRFQNLVWTLISIIIYIVKVCQVQGGCQLPELSDTLLMLTGISGATYLALRTGENKPVPATK